MPLARTLRVCVRSAGIALALPLALVHDTVLAAGRLAGAPACVARGLAAASLLFSCAVAGEAALHALRATLRWPVAAAAAAHPSAALLFSAMPCKYINSFATSVYTALPSPATALIDFVFQLQRTSASEQPSIPILKMEIEIHHSTVSAVAGLAQAIMAFTTACSVLVACCAEMAIAHPVLSSVLITATTIAIVI